MKKISSIVIAICLLAFIIGCGKDEYALEKEFWYTKRRADNIFKNPHASPPAQLKLAVKLLNQFIQKNQKSTLAVDAEFTIARLYMAKEQYDDARGQLRKLLEKYKQSEPISSMAIFLMGNSYQIEDKWSLALEQYKKIINDYPITPLGIELPIYIAQYYNVKSLKEKMTVSFQEAAIHYLGLAAKYPNSRLDYMARNLAAQCYMSIKDWENALNVLNSLIEKYDGKANLEEVLIMKAIIYKKEIKNVSKTKETLEKLIKDYPQSKFAKPAKKLLEELGENEPNKQTR